MEFINREKIKELSNPGVVSRQLINPENSKSERVTITEVHLEVGASQPRHIISYNYAGILPNELLNKFYSRCTQKETA